MSTSPLTREDVERLRSRAESSSKLDLSHQNLRQINLSYFNLQGVNLRGADLREANLRGINLSEAYLQGANLSGADLDGANLSRAHLSDNGANRVDLRDVKLSYATLKGLDLRGFDLRELDLQNADLNESDLRDALLHGTNLSGADLSTALLHGPELRGARLYNDERLNNWRSSGQRRISTEQQLPAGGFRSTQSNYLDLYDYRRSVFNMDREKREALLASVDPGIVLQRYRDAKDRLFAHHPQTALTQEQVSTFTGLNYFPYNPALQFAVEIDTTIEPASYEAVMDTHKKMTMVAVGRVHLVIDGQEVTLTLYWLDIYGGGLFLPFRDTTNGHETYGGGRYLFDTIKGNDFLTVRDDDGMERMIVDFNYAYNPSCAYNERFICPLSPLENKLPVAIHAGEKKYVDTNLRSKRPF